MAHTAKYAIAYVNSRGEEIRSGGSKTFTSMAEAKRALQEVKKQPFQPKGKFVVIEL